MIQGVIEHFSYLALFVVLFLGGLGVPIPEEAAIVTGGVLAHAQVILWWIGLPVCLAGVLAADCTLYWAGWHWGRVVLDWPLARRVVPADRAATLLAAYERHGVSIVLTARHVFGLRVAAFVAAGIARIAFWKFLLADFTGALVSVPLSFGLAYAFSDRIEAILADVHQIERWLAFAALVVAAAWLAIAARRRARRLR